MLHKLIKGIAPVAALAFGAGLSGCDGVNFNIGETKGVPLAKLDTSGEPPTKLVLAGPDTVLVRDGEALDIDVEGDPAVVDALRFSLEEGTLGIMRKETDGFKSSQDEVRATVRVTMPSPSSLVLAGSGRIESETLSNDASVTIAGSGQARTNAISAEKLDLTIAGSGTYHGAGTARALNLTVAGSGKADTQGLKVEGADVTIAGSGDAAFASDGTVDATIMGSGNVTVTGRATCKVNSMGSGSVTCRAAEAAASDATPDDEA